MQLRTAYCLDALFKRRDRNRLLHTCHTRIETGGAVHFVETPSAAADRLDAPGLAFPSAFGIKGLLHDPFRCSDSMVDVLTLTFTGPALPSLVSVDADFLAGLVHYDALPDMQGPDLATFIAMLRNAGGFWNQLSFRPAGAGASERNAA